MKILLEHFKTDFLKVKIIYNMQINTNWYILLFIPL